MLTAHGVTQLIDVRAVPRSRRNPQFNTEALSGRLAAADIGYAHAPGLGGFRRSAPWRRVPGPPQACQSGQAQQRAPDWAGSQALHSRQP